MRVPAAIAAALLLASASASRASSYSYEDVYRGIVDPVADGIPRDEPYLGDPFTLTFLVDLDPNAPNAYATPTGDGGYNYFTSHGSLVESAIFDVAGQHYVIPGTDSSFSSRQVYEPGLFNGVSDGTTSTSGPYVWASIGSYDHQILQSDKLGSPAQYDVPAMLDPQADTALGFVGKYGPGGRYFSWLDISSFSSLPAGTGGALPEPATWMMLIMGFGFIGRMLRRGTDGRGTQPFGSSRPAASASGCPA